MQSAHHRQACATTNLTCARCHDVSKIAMTHFDTSLAWRQLVLRMRRLPGSGITDAETLTAEPFDAILLDAPCSATGTLRRHPDVAWTKTTADLGKLQSELVELRQRWARRRR